MNNSALYALLRASEARERQQALQHLREGFPNEARDICKQFKLSEADAQPVLEAALISFEAQIQHYAFVPDMDNVFRYTLATECVLRRLADAGFVSPLDPFDRQVQTPGWSTAPDWSKKITAIRDAAGPEVQALLQVLELRHLAPEKAAQDCFEALGVELRSKDHIFSARRFYIGYFLKQWMLQRVDNHFSKR